MVPPLVQRMSRGPTLPVVSRLTLLPSVAATQRSSPPLAPRKATIRPFFEMHPSDAGGPIRSARRWMSSQSMSPGLGGAVPGPPPVDGFCNDSTWTAIPVRRWLRNASLFAPQLTSALNVAYRVTLTAGFEPSDGMMYSSLAYEPSARE